MVQQRVWLASTPDRHHERVGDELRGHLGLHRPADHPAGEKVDDGRNIQPALCGPDIGEVGDPALVGPLGMELPIERVGSDCRPLALIPRQPSSAWPRAQCLRPHQPLDPMQATIDAFSQHVSPDAARAIGAIRADEACPDLRANLLVVTRTLARRPVEPGMEARSRHIQRFTKPRHRPDTTVLRDEREPHVTSFAK